MRILILTSSFPYPPLDGIRIKTYHLIKGLAARGHNIQLLSFVKNADLICPYNYKFAEYCETISVHKETKWNLSMLSSLLSKHLLYSVFSSSSTTFIRKLDNLTKNKNIDLVHFDTILLAQYLKLTKNHYPSILSINDSLSLASRDMVFIKKEVPFIEKIYFMTRYPIETLYERSNYEKFQKIHVVSPIDKGYLCSLNPRIDVEVIPNGVDTDFFRPSETLFLNGHSIIYMADLNAHHHEVAWLLGKVLPKITKAMPNVTLYLVGKGLPLDLLYEAKKKSNVLVTGHVNDIRPFLNRAHVFIDPTFKRGGIPNHVLEAMSMGKAVVGTLFSFLAIKGAKPWKNVVAAKDEKDFASKIVYLLENENERKSIGANARQLIESKYTWEKIIPKYEEMYENAIKKFDKCRISKNVVSVH